MFDKENWIFSPEDFKRLSEFAIATQQLSSNSPKKDVKGRSRLIQRTACYHGLALLQTTAPPEVECSNRAKYRRPMRPFHRTCFNGGNGGLSVSRN
jgi:hypothetical protein